MKDLKEMFDALLAGEILAHKEDSDFTIEIENGELNISNYHIIIPERWEIKKKPDYLKIAHEDGEFYEHTKHSLERWNFRFEYLNFEEEWKSAKKATKRQKETIKTHCVKSARDNGGEVNYYISTNDVVFVCNDLLETIITVIPFVDTVKTNKPTTNKSYRNYKHKRKNPSFNGN